MFLRSVVKTSAMPSGALLLAADTSRCSVRGKTKLIMTAKKAAKKTLSKNLWEAVPVGTRYQNAVGDVWVKEENGFLFCEEKKQSMLNIGQITQHFTNPVHQVVNQNTSGTTL